VARERARRSQCVSPWRNESAMAKILLVDSDASVRTSVGLLLRKRGYEVHEAESEEEALEHLRKDRLDLVLTELSFGDRLVGMKILEWVKAQGAATDVIVLTGQRGIQAASDAIQGGAYRYLTKPFDPEMLLLTVEHALERRRLRNQVRRLSSALKRREGIAGIVYRSRQMEEILRLVRRVAQVASTVLIQGESGTGKELIARAIHFLSPRKSGPFQAVDCGAIPESLLESELFGHTRGAFTGADAPRQGMFEVAHGGTLFLDEVGELPLSLQVKLLRTLQEGEIRPLGSNQTRKVDVRVVAATNKDLGAEVAAGRFREDLYYRLNVISIRVPPLRERPEDILPLARHFLSEYGARMLSAAPLQIDPGAAALLERYPWPGNVRELENAMQRAVALGSGGVLRIEDLPDSIRGEKASQIATAGFGKGEDLPLAEMEKRYILEVLRRHGGDRSRTAAILGIGRNTLWRKLKSYGYRD